MVEMQNIIHLREGYQSKSGSVCVMVGMLMVNSAKHGFPPPCHISDFPLRLMDSFDGRGGGTSRRWRSKRGNRL